MICDNDEHEYKAAISSFTIDTIFNGKLQKI